MIYKYLPEERVTILENGEIRFTQPRALNDPFESSPLIDSNTDLNDIINKAESMLHDYWLNLSSNERTEENYKTLQKTVSDGCEKVAHLLNPANVGIKVMDLVNLSIGVLSLSRTFTNLLMWSHYANSHKGFVIGIDDSHDFFHEKNQNGFNSFPRKVSYTTQRGPIKPDAPNLYEKMLCEKSIDWAYEEEVRVFRAFSEYTKISCFDDVGHPVCLITLPKECIKSIYIGAHAGLKLKNKIFESIAAQALNLSVFEMKISKTRYEVEAHEVGFRNDV